MKDCRTPPSELSRGPAARAEGIADVSLGCPTLPNQLSSQMTYRDRHFEHDQREYERETAILLLKGFSHREITSIAGKSEKTVRQHSVAIYRKSGLGGRAELSAFFLEDLLLPATSKASADPASSDE